MPQAVSIQFLYMVLYYIKFLQLIKYLSLDINLSLYWRPGHFSSHYAYSMKPTTYYCDIDLEISLYNPGPSYPFPFSFTYVTLFYPLIMRYINCCASFMSTDVDVLNEPK